jgi:non-specific serine/threonine protein kinase
MTKPLKRRFTYNFYNISDDPLLLKKDTNITDISSYKIIKFSYESHIYKYDNKKQKIIKYYLVLNQKMMLYFKDENKDKYRGLHYLSDINAEVFYNKKELFYIKGEKYFYLTLKIKEKKKYFVSLSEFEIRKWFEIFKKTINPHKSRNIKDYYTLKETLSEGKYGLVKRAINLKTREEVSIKIIGRKDLVDDKKLKEVKQEIEILMHCNHQGIVKYIDYFEEKNKEKNTNNIYIVMEHLSGGDLASHIVRNGPLSEKKVVSISLKIAKSLQYLHKLGIVHRDIKPENIVLDSQNNPKIIDFGLSRIIHHNEFLNECFGTFYYASPEIHNKTKYNKSTDIWSFGILIFYIFTGDFPFPKTKEKSLLCIKDLQKEFDFEDYCDFTYCSFELKNLLKRCLKKDYKKRIEINEIINDPLFKKIQ